LPHPAAYGAIARIFDKFVREDSALLLEDAVRKMTSYPAQLFGLRERGVIRPGAYADLVLCDLGKIKDRATFSHPRRLAVGIKTVLVNGQIAFADGKVASTLHGAVLKR
jgi:N-acyl-D-aspartate/D-glutamate deacylase